MSHYSRCPGCSCLSLDTDTLRCECGWYEGKEADATIARLTAELATTKDAWKSSVDEWREMSVRAEAAEARAAAAERLKERAVNIACKFAQACIDSTRFNRGAEFSIDDTDELVRLAALPEPSGAPVESMTRAEVQAELAARGIDVAPAIAAVREALAAKAARRGCPTPGCAGPGPDWADQGPDPAAAIPIPCTGCGAQPVADV